MFKFKSDPKAATARMILPAAANPSDIYQIGMFVDDGECERDRGV